jgi:hypothetical protein
MGSLLWAVMFAACQPDGPNFLDLDRIEAQPNPPLLDEVWQTDVLKQRATPEVDVLWVIDNSGSMDMEQARLARNFPSFIQYFVESGLDWHIGVISTDTSAPDQSGRLQGASGLRYLTPESPRPVELFSQMAQLGTTGSADERGRRSAWLALTDPLRSGFNGGFYREDASLHVVVISDEPDATEQPTRNEFVSWMRALKADPEDVTFSAIVGPAPSGCANSDGTFANSGANYLDLVQAIGGVSESICEDDWSDALEELGLQASGLRTEFFLTEVPDPSTIEVEARFDGYQYPGVVDTDAAPVEGCDADIGAAGPRQEACEDNGSCFHWRYDCLRNSIQITDWIPPQLAEISVRYQLRSDVDGG